jgi:hypothetical protein
MGVMGIDDRKLHRVSMGMKHGFYSCASTTWSARNTAPDNAMIKFGRP